MIPPQKKRAGKTRDLVLLVIFVLLVAGNIWQGIAGGGVRRTLRDLKKEDKAKDRRRDQIIDSVNLEISWLMDSIRAKEDTVAVEIPRERVQTGTKRKKNTVKYVTIINDINGDTLDESLDRLGTNLHANK